MNEETVARCKLSTKIKGEEKRRKTSYVEALSSIFLPKLMYQTCDFCSRRTKLHVGM